MFILITTLLNAVRRHTFRHETLHTQIMDDYTTWNTQHPTYYQLPCINKHGIKAVMSHAKHTQNTPETGSLQTKGVDEEE